jgi:hypothetical protein
MCTIALLLHILVCLTISYWQSGPQLRRMVLAVQGRHQWREQEQQRRLRAEPMCRARREDDEMLKILASAARRAQLSGWRV